MIEMDDLIEKLGDLAHRQWSGWVEYMLENLDSEHINGWKRQIATEYKNLTENEKDSDRAEARKVVELIKREMPGIFEAAELSGAKRLHDNQ